MTMKNKLNLIPLLLTLLVVGCQGSKNTTAGNPFVPLAITSSAANSTVAKGNKTLWDLLIPKSFAYPPPAILSDAVGSSVTINSIWLNFRQIEFKINEVNSGSEMDGDSIEFDNVFSVDLLSNSPQPFVAGNVSITSLRRIKIKLAKTTTLPTGAPSGFLGKSVFISGTVNGHAFTYSTENETIIEVAGPTLLAVIENKTLLVELKIANLVKRINLSAITASTNINDSNRVLVSNPCANIEVGAADLFTCFFKGIGKESNLGRDDDGDYVIDADEDAVK